MSSVALGALAGACTPAVTSRSPTAAAAAKTRRVVDSNVLRADYAGSKSCEPCHAELVARWNGAPMHKMTRLAGAPDVKTPFDGRTFRFKEDQVELLSARGARFMRLRSGGRTSLHRVTKIIGGRVREDFAGVEVADEAQPATGIERILPVSFFIETGELRYKGYSVQAVERPGMRTTAPWREACLFCHNTVPFLSSALGHLAGRHGYQASDVDALLPVDRRSPLVVDDAPGLARAVHDEATKLGVDKTSVGDLATELRQTITATRRGFGVDQLVEVGIGCEACHNGARQHVDDPTKLPAFEPVSPLLHRTKRPGDANAQAINQVCAKCHQVLFSRYPHTWEGGARSQPTPGGSTINSGEARDFLLGGCASKMSCATCHDPHDPSGKTRTKDLASPAGNALCVGCHATYAAPDAVARHTHHAPAREGSFCVSCHMPKKNLSLDTRLAVYHRIGSPTDRARVEADRPLECGLCHADKTVSDLVTTMELWWGKTYDRAALQKLYGDPGQRVLDATLATGKPHERAVAAFLLGDTKDRRHAPAIAHEMTNEIPLVRYYARDALEKLLQERSPVDMHQDNAAIAQQTEAWLKTKGLQTKVPTGQILTSQPPAEDLPERVRAQPQGSWPEELVLGIASEWSLPSRIAQSCRCHDSWAAPLSFVCWRAAAWARSTSRPSARSRAPSARAS